MTPQIIVLCLTALNILSAFHKHGKTGDTRALITTLLSIALMSGLLEWGGFYAPLFN